MSIEIPLKGFSNLISHISRLLMPLHLTYYSSPIGIIEITGNEDGIESLYFVDAKKDDSQIIPAELKECIYQLDEYFKGIRKDFGLKLNPQGSEFQKKVWNQLLTVPFGKTASYFFLKFTSLWI